jgi:multisubunit Na+/H+ antiporter MnhG subunit
MTTAPLSKFDLMAPPVVKTIQQRSLIIGVIFSLIAVAGALVLKQPDEFFRAYLMAFMAWLGVTLGSMAILMLRHLTKGAWGMVIRRILGAAMRCVP